MLKTLSLLNIDAIPEDADCLLVYAPTSDLSKEEATMLSNFVYGGGRLLVISGPVEEGALTNLNTIVENYGGQLIWIGSSDFAGDTFNS